MIPCSSDKEKKECSRVKTYANFKHQRTMEVSKIYEIGRRLLRYIYDRVSRMERTPFSPIDGATIKFATTIQNGNQLPFYANLTPKNSIWMSSLTFRVIHSPTRWNLLMSSFPASVEDTWFCLPKKSFKNWEILYLFVSAGKFKPINKCVLKLSRLSRRNKKSTRFFWWEKLRYIMFIRRYFLARAGSKIL